MRIPTLLEMKSKIGNLQKKRIDRTSEEARASNRSGSKYVVRSRVVSEGAMREVRETFTFFAAKTFLSV